MSCLVPFVFSLFFILLFSPPPPPLSSFPFSFPLSSSSFLLSSSSSFPSLPSISIENSSQHRRERTAGRSAGGMPGVTAGMLRNKTGRISPNFTLWQSTGNPPTSIPQFLLLEAPMCRNSARLWSGDWLGRQDSTGPVSSCWLCHPISLSAHCLSLWPSTQDPTHSYGDRMHHPLCLVFQPTRNCWHRDGPPFHDMCPKDSETMTIFHEARNCSQVGITPGLHLRRLELVGL